jgi:broad specificity phosphatase PhoE
MEEFDRFAFDGDSIREVEEEEEESFGKWQKNPENSNEEA